MITSDLKHNVTYNHLIDSGTDEYNQPTRTSEEVSEKCFFDMPKNILLLNENKREVQVDAIIYMKASSVITLDDEVVLVSDSSGNTISDLKMRVAKILKGSDFSKLHHLEVQLLKI